MRFFVETHHVDEQNARIFIEDEEQVNHIARALRMKLGEKIDVCVQNKSVFECVISDIKEGIECEILSKRELEHGENRIDLFQAIVKSSHWDYLIQKNVEFGISSITPVSTIRCVAKYDEKSEHKKIARLQKISDSASKQAFRSYIPPVNMPLSFAQLSGMIGQYDLFLVAYENEKHRFLKDLETELKDAKKIGIFIGPEGGFETSEIDRLCDYKNVRIISLGERILRTESAGAYLLAQINYVYGN